MTKRIGFACKWIDDPSQVNGISAKDSAKQYNTGTTTVAWLNRQTREVAEQKLWELMQQNISSVYKLVEKVGSLDESLRMVRLSSDILPVYTHDQWRYFWQLADVQAYMATHFQKVGDVARTNNVRVSFHPGQFCVLASDRSDVVERSIEEFEYHADMARLMGYGQKFQDMKINVHIAGRAGPAGIREVYKRLSPEARNCITIENEEMTYGLTDCLSLADCLPIVLDIHHHWVREGEYIQPEDDRVHRVLESWRGVRPTCHFSTSREDYITGHDTNRAPEYQTLLESGYKKSKLRAHSDFAWNTAVNEWALQFLDDFDIMVECKSKNLGAYRLYEFWKQLENRV